MAHFSHKHGEGCEPSKAVTIAYKRYEKQMKRESNRQELIVTMMRDELNVLSRISPLLEVQFGYLDFNKDLPDLVIATLQVQNEDITWISR